MSKKIRIIKQSELDNLSGAKKPITKTNHVGVEIEFYSKANGFEIGQYLILSGLEKHCQLKDDVSISSPGRSEGHELAIIAEENDIIRVITRVCRMLKYFQAKVNKSCGLHVHIDMRNRNKEVVFHNLVTAQPLLYSINPPSRLKNDYCYPTTSSDINAVDGWDRTGVNKGALGRHNTLEIRIHCGSTNREKITNWIKLLLQIADRPDKVINSVTKLSEFCTEFGVGKNLHGYIVERLEKFKRPKEKLISLDIDYDDDEDENIFD